MKTTISPENRKRIKVDFFTSENSALQIETLGVYRFDPWATLQQYPRAVLLKCVCRSSNPLGILRVPNDRILQTVSEVEFYSPADRVYKPLENVDAAFSRLKSAAYFVEFVKLIGKQKMIFVFNTFQNEL